MKSRPFLGTVDSFRKAFPHVNTLSFVGRQRVDVMGHVREDRYSADNLLQVIPCANPECQQGGFNLLPYLLGTAAHVDAEIWCGGHEGTPKGRRKGAPCWNTLTFTIDMTFQGKE